jgi:hypothetical protein
VSLINLSIDEANISLCFLVLQTINEPRNLDFGELSKLMHINDVEFLKTLIDENFISYKFKDVLGFDDLDSIKSTLDEVELEEYEVDIASAEILGEITNSALLIGLIDKVNDDFPITIKFLKNEKYSLFERTFNKYLSDFELGRLEQENEVNMIQTDKSVEIVTKELQFINSTTGKTREIKFSTDSLTTDNKGLLVNTTIIYMHKSSLIFIEGVKDFGFIIDASSLLTNSPKKNITNIYKYKGIELSPNGKLFAKHSGKYFRSKLSTSNGISFVIIASLLSLHSEFPNKDKFHFDELKDKISQLGEELCNENDINRIRSLNYDVLYSNYTKTLARKLKKALDISIKHEKPHLWIEVLKPTPK